MYVDIIPNRNSPPAILLRESYREDGKVKKRTLANISKLPKETIENIKQALFGQTEDTASQLESGPVYAVLFALNSLSNKLAIGKALGNSRVAQFVKFLIYARIAHQGSRLSATRWARDHAVKEVLNLNYFDEDDLYSALDWAALNQEKIERKLFKKYVKDNGKLPALVLYDVTSSYLEGEQNELAEYGYDRDGKRGKKIIVIGLLTAPDGEPLSVEVFEGNTSDPATVELQIKKLVDRFGLKEIIFVGDRGMVKSKGKKALEDANFKYISALTDPQVRKLLKKKVFQPGLFDENVVEVEHGNKTLVLRRDELTFRKERHRREDKLQRLKSGVNDRNKFVKQSQKADPQAGLRKFNTWIKRHKISSFIIIELEGDTLKINLDQDAMDNDSLLDGCYVIESNVDSKIMDAQNIHDRYKDLQNVERNFRGMKSVFLEMRPIFVRKEKRTKGHVFISMLALKIIRHMEKSLHDVFGTTDDNDKAENIDCALNALSRLCLLNKTIGDEIIATLPKPDSRQKQILKALGVELTPPRIHSPSV